MRAGHQGVDPLDVLGGGDGLLADPDVDQGRQWCLQGDSDGVQTVNGDTLLAALDLADELSTQSGQLPELVLREPALLAKRAQTLADELSNVPFCALSHRYRRSLEVPSDAKMTPPVYPTPRSVASALTLRCAICSSRPWRSPESSRREHWKSASIAWP